MKASGIGGQAVIEGVMMKNKSAYAVAVRKPDHKIVVEKGTYTSAKEKHRILRLPILRGVAAFVESLVLGMKTLTFSSKFFEEEEEPGKFEKAIQKVFKGKAESVVTGLTVVCSIVLAVAVFMLLPLWIVGLMQKAVSSDAVLAMIEGVLRLLIFIGYIAAISQMEEIKRVFMYHGAEHKVINCIEHGLEPTTANVRKQSRLHKRCGTSFMFLVMFISILFFIFIHTDVIWLRYVLRILLVPVIAGVSYEFIQLAGKRETGFFNLLSKPGLWLQKLTTREPDAEMIEVAVASVEAVFDWHAFLEENFGGHKKGKKSAKKADKHGQKKEHEKNQPAAAAVTEEKEEEPAVDLAARFDVNFVEEQAKESREKLAAKVHVAEPAKELAAAKESTERKTELDEEDDEILKALDRYFEFDGPKTVMEISDEPKK